METGKENPKPTVKVAMFQEIIAPYRVPVFNFIRQNADFDFKAFFLSATQDGRKWPVPWEELKFPFEVLPGLRWEGKNLRALHFNSGILSRLRREKFDTIVTGGWHQPAYYLLLFYAKAAGKKILLWSESHAWDSRKRSFLNEAARRMFVRLSNGAIASGKAARDYLVSLGAKPEKIWTAPNAVDSDFYEAKMREWLPRRERVKSEKKLPRQNLLYVGRLVKEKGVDLLLEAYADLAAEFPNLGLILCGEGRERESLEAFCRQRRLAKVFFPGFLDRENLVPYYAAADLLVLPSRTEPWGLVINEAMTCGLPVVCSNRVGAAADLVRPGENGFVFPPEETGGLRKSLRSLLSSPDRLKAFGEASKRIIRDCSPRACAEGFMQAVREA